jgi:hypothetical protein
MKGLPGLVGMLAGLVPTLGSYYKTEAADVFAPPAARGGDGGGGGRGGGSGGGGAGSGGAVAAAAAAASAAVAEPEPVAAGSK